MTPPPPITKITGHVAAAARSGKLRYIDETSGAAFYESRATALFDHFIAVALCSRANRQFTPLTAQEIKALIGKKRRRTGR